MVRIAGGAPLAVRWGLDGFWSYGADASLCRKAINALNGELLSVSAAQPGSGCAHGDASLVNV